ncbi:MAG: putative dual-specificity RNA methyltransferase RlmN [Phycisphaerae bacterium]|nr:MAG: putative dual-specificity RNA methyltransferase RlmN [Phycisphaerae bacterium]
MIVPMSDTQAKNCPVDFLGLGSDQFDTLVVEWGMPRFRAKQVRNWVYDKLVLDFDRMSNLSKLDREKLRERIDLGQSQTRADLTSQDGTQKLLLEWPGGAQAETVMIPDGDRRTACVSSQVGCPVGCRFCASGLEGVKGNLTAAQIVEQVMQLNRRLSAKSKNPSGKPERINHIVFMGMGEPLANYANVMQAVRVLHDPGCLNISARKITISTVGVPVRMKQLAEEDLPLNLAISLHAPNEALRRELIPWAEHFSMDEILDAARYYFQKTGREITFEYILLSGVNDRPEHARQLAQVCRTVRANVNLLRYNEVESLPYERPKNDAVIRFQETLRRAGINAHVRKSRGRDISAACGQLRRRENQKLIQLNAPASI